MLIVKNRKVQQRLKVVHLCTDLSNAPEPQNLKHIYTLLVYDHVLCLSPCFVVISLSFPHVQATYSLPL